MPRASIRTSSLTGRLLLLTCTVVAAAITAGCQSASPSGTSTAITTQPGQTKAPAVTTTATPPATAASPLLALLSNVPDSKENLSYVEYNNYDLLKKTLSGTVDSKATSTVSDTFSLIAKSGAAPGPFISGLGAYGLRGPVFQYLGFDQLAVKQSLQAGQPPARLEVVAGDIDPAAFQKALATCTACPKPELIARGEATIYAWGLDNAIDVSKVLAAPAYDELGRGGRLVILPGIALRSTSTDAIGGMVDAHAGTRPSLAQREEMASVARVLESLGSYSAYITNQTQASSALYATDKSTRLRPYVLLVTSIGKDDRGFFDGVVLVHENEQNARDNVDLIKQRIATTTSVQTKTGWNKTFTQVETRSEGRLTIAKLYSETARSVWVNWVMARDPLMLHE